MSKKNIFENQFDENDEDSEEDNDYEEDDSEEDGDNEEDDSEEDGDDEEDDSEEDGDDEEDDSELLDSHILEIATPFDAEPSNSSAHSSGIRIINCNRGKRIEFSKTILSVLDYPPKINFCFTKKYLIILTSKHGFPLRGHNHNTVYSASLVSEITKQFALDFSDCTCITCLGYKRIDSEDFNAIAIALR